MKCSYTHYEALLTGQHAHINYMKLKYFKLNVSELFNTISVPLLDFILWLFTNVETAKS
jgi:hypothetical protein